MKIVEVINIPVRYNGITYQPGESFEMQDEHVIETLVEVTGEVEKVPKALEEMTIPELKDYAAEHGIDLGEAKKKEEILTVLYEEKQDNPE
ncbi:hypothetical protein [Heyndrickxia oleronia]|uniref:hypothetical protein n=1 Tax=Heyndrickxia oleronia TaxID=38875 RepID=UPI001B274311|nr:hypothetical protein [Heyndrickxia oleronia]GIN37801.1 hypothetical protein J19TS1_07500 [Heyndrickxia oleronia]